MKSILTTLVCVAALVFASGCTSDSVTPLSKMCDVYADIADNNEAVAKAFQEVYSAPRDKQGELQQKATSLSRETQIKNEALAEAAANLVAELKDSEINCEVAEGLGFTVEKAYFATVNAQPKLANIVIVAQVNGEAGTPQYVLMLNEHGEVVTRTLGRYADGKISINFHVTTNRGSGPAHVYGSVRSLKIVSESEYKGGTAPAEPTEAAADSDNNYENEGNSDPEPAYQAQEDSSAESVTVNGIVIQKGAPLAETLRKFSSITWDYNADFGVTATVGNVWIVIDDSDLTQKGLDIINAITSDMENNIAFSVDYIKPTAKVKNFENQ